MRSYAVGVTVLIGSAIVLAVMPSPVAAQSTGFVTGFPGKDPAGDDEIGWGPAYRPETSFSQPGTPPTPGDFAGAAYRARTGRGPYDAVQGAEATGAIGARPRGRTGVSARAPRPHARAARPARPHAHLTAHRSAAAEPRR
jgi:hypothetical protein